MTRTDPDAPIYVLKLRPAAGTDGVRALRWLLKIAWRRFQLRCVSVEQQTHNPSIGTSRTARKRQGTEVAGRSD